MRDDRREPQRPLFKPFRLSQWYESERRDKPDTKACGRCRGSGVGRYIDDKLVQPYAGCGGAGYLA